MSTHLRPLEIRRRMGRMDWLPPEPFGPDGWLMVNTDRTASVIASVSDHDETGVEWIHASIARTDRTPDYEDLVALHHAVWGDTGFAYQVFAPADQHVNIHPNALHLWGRLDGAPVLPEFGMPLGPFDRSI